MTGLSVVGWLMILAGLKLSALAAWCLVREYRAARSEEHAIQSALGKTRFQVGDQVTIDVAVDEDSLGVEAACPRRIFAVEYDGTEQDVSEIYPEHSFGPPPADLRIRDQDGTVREYTYWSSDGVIARYLRYHGKWGTA